MWLIGGAKSKVRPVDGGRRVQRRCATCDKVTTFQECDVLDSVSVFFVSLFDHTSRRMVCTGCGEDHYVEEWLREAPPSASTPKKLAATAAAPKRRAVSEAEIDAELAALKRRLASEKKGS